MNCVLGKPLKANVVAISELCAKYEESSGRETTSFSYFLESAFSLFIGELGASGTGEIVLTRLSLTTNWLPAICSSEREGRLHVFVSFLEGFGFLKGWSRKTVADRSTTEGKALGLGWGRIEINISRRKTFPASRRPPPSPRPPWAERQGRGCSRRQGYIF